MYVIGCVIRLVGSNVFGLNNFENPLESDDDQIHADTKDILITLPTYMFFIVYCILLSSLAEIYFITHTNERQERASLYRKLHSDDDPFSEGSEYRTRSYKVINIVIIVTTVLVAALFVIEALIIILSSDDQWVLKAVLQLVTVILYFLISLGFCVFGWLIFFQSRRILKSLPAGNDNRSVVKFNAKKAESQKILLGNSIISLFLFLVFIVRLVLISIWTYFILWRKSTWCFVNFSPYFLYYILFEAIPLSLILFVFAIIPGKSRPKSYFNLRASY